MILSYISQPLNDMFIKKIKIKINNTGDTVDLLPYSPSKTSIGTSGT